MVAPTVSSPPSATPPPRGSAPPAPDAVVGVEPPTPRPNLLRRAIRFWIPRTSGRRRRADGLQSGPGPDLPCWIVALAIGIVAAWLFESLATAPIPPGGDPSQWLLLAFPYVGLPVPSEIQLFSYPPL